MQPAARIGSAASSRSSGQSKIRLLVGSGGHSNYPIVLFFVLYDFFGCHGKFF
jgi:hypothetical protein